jgi:twitching motility protein PilT
MTANNSLLSGNHDQRPDPDAMASVVIAELAGHAVDDPGSLEQLLGQTVAMGGSDLHLAVGSAPCVRLHGTLAPLRGWPRLRPADTERLVRTALTDEQWQRFGLQHELDTAYSVHGVSRFRVNIYQQRGSVGAAFRVIPHSIPQLDDLGLPLSIEHFAHLQRGLVLITGPTGSGKSTTMASLIDVANRTRTGHIMTIEDPIEYLHDHRRCLVNQREVGLDTADFGIALKHVLRQDPDIILVGELRDIETTSVAVTAAETGHLVLATLHTQSAAQTIDRLIDIYPAHQQSQIRNQLANCLQGVVTQALAPRLDGLGRVAIAEVMVVSPAIRHLIREGKSHQIPSVIQSSAESGMISFDQSLANSYFEKLISKQSALDLAHDPAEFKRLARI